MAGRPTAWQHCTALYAAGVSQLSVSDGSATPDSRSTSPRDQPQRTVGRKRLLEEYNLEPELQRSVAAAEAHAGAKPKLHLVVLGHVDAGKSTLMGRLLHDLG